jgi:hypothetical protein
MKACSCASGLLHKLRAQILVTSLSMATAKGISHYNRIEIASTDVSNRRIHELRTVCVVEWWRDDKLGPTSWRSKLNAEKR